MSQWTTEKVPVPLRVGLAYGLGLGLGNLIAVFLFRLVSFLLQDVILAPSLLVGGVLLAIVIVTVGGGVGGFIGGYMLPIIDPPGPRRGYAWRGAVSLGIPYGLILFVLFILMYTLAVTDVVGVEAWDAVIVFTIIGVFFGLVSGVLHGALTTTRHVFRIAIVAMIGFAVGGAAFGYGTWLYLGSIPVGGLLGDGEYPLFFFFSVILFGLSGGAALGWVYQKLSTRVAEGRDKPVSRRVKLLGYGFGAVALIVLVGVFWQLLGDVAAMLIPRDANLATQIADDSIGTHWPAWGEISAENAADPALAAHAENAATVVWLDGTGDAQRLLLAQGERTSETQMAWQAPIMVADGASGLASPQVAVAADGRIHVAWLENPAQPRVMAAVCEAGACGGAVTVAASGACDGQSAESVPPSLSLAINPAGRALAVWGDFGVNAVTFDGADSATDAPVCVPGLTEAGNARIASHPDGSFTLVAEQSGDIVQAVFDADSWQATRVVGQGALPNVWVDEAGDAHVAWCSAESGVSVRHGEQVEQVSALPCLQRPSLAADSEGRLHILFASDEVERVLGDPGMQPVLYESVQSADETQWAPPAIIASSQTRSAASLATDAEGVLFSAWVDALNPAALHVAAKAAYDCTGTDIPRIAQATLDAVADRNFRPSGEQLALCKNQYNRLVYTPNPAPEFSDLPPTENGAFDVLADAMREARYEVLFATMAYDQGADGYGPGVVIAEAVADLYAKLDANPEAYPRGLTVRMLMGNSPKIDLNSQLWDLLADLRTAGVPVMRDPSIGWRLEVANFEGAFPHSHTKLLVVDGTDAITMGFNMEFRAMPIDHPSGRGGGDTDLGVYVTGPVAQDSRRVYDQLWEGAVLRYCPNLYTQIIPWQWYCRDSEAVVDHVPEVMRYAVTDGNTLALSMFRNHVFDESDQKVNAAFQSAETLIDVMHVDFDLPLECVINHFYDVCHFEHALPYMERVVDVVEANDVDVRVLLGVIPIQGVENTVAIEAFNEEIDERGLSDRVEVRWFDGLIHAKTSLIDDEFLIIGSQNLHSSGFGEGVGLTEYNIGVVDPQAIDDYRRLFEYHWERGRP